MTDFGTATTIGGRIQALRRARGMRTSKELADAIGGTMEIVSTVAGTTLRACVALEEPA